MNIKKEMKKIERERLIDERIENIENKQKEQEYEIKEIKKRIKSLKDSTDKLEEKLIDIKKNIEINI